MTKRTHMIWLKFSSLAVSIYATLFSIGTIRSLSRPVETVLDLSEWPIDGLQNYNASSTVFLSAILGGVMFGWAILIWLLSNIYEREPEAIRKAVVASLIVWFITDSLGCILSGHISNSITNIALIIILIGPLCIKSTEEAAESQSKIS